ncbi:MAG: TonB-dependent receptor, partial [Pseudomonadota bacterium]
FFFEGGNPDLDPEEGTAFSVGAVVRPSFVQGLFISLDYFNLEISNLIRSPDPEALLNGTESAGSVTRDANNVPTLDVRLNNGGERTVRGFDISVSQTIETPATGTFNFYTNGVVQTTNELVEGPVVTDFLGNFARSQPIPKFRGIFGMNWTDDVVDFAANVDYSTGISEVFMGETFDRDAWLSVDMQLGYDFSKYQKTSWLTDGLRAYIGVENLLNGALPFFISGNNGWDRSIGDLRGRYVYGGVRKSF